jgi:hypothetical protein
MKRRKKAIESFDDIEYRLTADNAADLIEYFKEHVERRGLLYEDCYEHFMPGSTTFAMFLINLENRHAWFDYTQVQEVYSILDVLMKKMPK